MLTQNVENHLSLRLRKHKLLGFLVKLKLHPSTLFYLRGVGGEQRHTPVTPSTPEAALKEH